jgi:glyoxylase-like metal-dependent hydrolase (beta-lactamase superfamily II)
MKQIVPGLFTFTGLRAGRVYLFTEGDGLTLIDASIPPAGGAILKQLKAAGYEPSDLKRIVITHAHPDHVGGVPDLIRATGAELIVPEGERATVNGEIPIPRAPGGLTPPETILKDMQVDRTLAPDEMLDEVAGGLQAIFTPGHSPGHMSFWHPGKQVLITGDVIFNIPRRMRLPFRMLTVDMAENIRSIGKLVPLDPQVLCFGHGKPILEHASPTLRRFAESVGAV